MVVQSEFKSRRHSSQLKKFTPARCWLTAVFMNKLVSPDRRIPGAGSVSRTGRNERARCHQSLILLDTTEKLSIRVVGLLIVDLRHCVITFIQECVEWEFHVIARVTVSAQRNRRGWQIFPQFCHKTSCGHIFSRLFIFDLSVHDITVQIQSRNTLCSQSGFSERVIAINVMPSPNLNSFGPQAAATGAT